MYAAGFSEYDAGNPAYYAGFPIFFLFLQLTLSGRSIAARRVLKPYV